MKLWIVTPMIWVGDILRLADEMSGHAWEGVVARAETEERARQRAGEYWREYVGGHSEPQWLNPEQVECKEITPDGDEDVLLAYFK